MTAAEVVETNPCDAADCSASMRPRQWMPRKYAGQDPATAEPAGFNEAAALPPRKMRRLRPITGHVATLQ